MEGTLTADFTVPSTWPPIDLVNVYDGQADGATLRVFASPLGTLQFHVHRPDDQIDYETPRLTLPDYPFLKVAFAWGRPEGIGLAVNGQLIHKATESPIAVKAETHSPTGFRSPLQYEIPAGCNDIELSLLRSVLELQERIARIDRFNLLQASGILRRLILDARPVMHLANRHHRQRLRFPAVAERHVKGLGVETSFQFVNLCPAYAAPAQIQWLGLDEILAKGVLKDHERAFSVRDVIDVCANIKGGIHFGEPISQSDESLVKLDEHYLPFFIEASLAALPGIGWTFIVGMRELINAIRERPNAGA